MTSKNVWKMSLFEHYFKIILKLGSGFGSGTASKWKVGSRSGFTSASAWHAGSRISIRHCWRAVGEIYDFLDMSLKAKGDRGRGNNCFCRYQHLKKGQNYLYLQGISPIQYIQQPAQQSLLPETNQYRWTNKPVLPLEHLFCELLYIITNLGPVHVNKSN